MQTKDNEDSPKEFSLEENQEARAFLRERFLRVISSVTGKPCQLYTADDSIVSGEFQGCDKEVENYLIKNLKTPVFEYSSVLVRANDIKTITFPNALKISNPEY
ncbi:hypothetical protein LSTR_LSTR014404 [Laodelphax striatellus]|uniref:Gem-associated protein 7 n=1 Tax=Laodelphax striatellus TaxID=195883 RepID=A0A482WL76_LAOST|nr:hypothetical protein LSTR_LSTR014404 [Laodelphax striatellus]